MRDLGPELAEDAPLFADVADGPDGGRAWWLTTSDGRRVRVALWAGPQARGTVFLFPGRTEYVEKYGRAARDLAARGYGTFTIDWRGQGLADRMLPNRKLGHVAAFPDYQLDVAAMLAQGRTLDLPRPWVLIGHSMGGCIGLRALMEGMPVTAAVFSAPMWGIQISTFMRPVAWTLSSVSRPLGMSHVIAPGQQEETYVLRADFAENTLTSDPAMFDHMRSQLRSHPELALGGPSLNWLNESLVEMRALAARPAPEVPCLTALGLDEAIVDPLRIRRRMATWPGGTLDLIPGARHEIMMETPAIRGRFFDEAVALFDASR